MIEITEKTWPSPLKDKWSLRFVHSVHEWFSGEAKKKSLMTFVKVEDCYNIKYVVFGWKIFTIITQNVYKREMRKYLDGTDNNVYGLGRYSHPGAIIVFINSQKIDILKIALRKLCDYPWHI